MEQKTYKILFIFGFILNCTLASALLISLSYIDFEEEIIEEEIAIDTINKKEFEHDSIILNCINSSPVFKVTTRHNEDRKKSIYLEFEDYLIKLTYFYAIKFERQDGIDVSLTDTVGTSYFTRSGYFYDTYLGYFNLDISDSTIDKLKEYCKLQKH